MISEYIIKNNGATVSGQGKIVTLKSGYQVSKRDLGRIAIKDFTEAMAQDIVCYGLKRGEYAGFWVEDGYVYSDISVRIATKKQAISNGKQLNQIAIWDWKKQCNVYCGV